MIALPRILCNKPAVCKENIDLLEKAMEVGSSFPTWVKDQRASHGQPNLTLYLSKLGKKNLIFEEIDNARISKSWEGSLVLCRFEIRTVPGVQPELYQFRSNLLGFENRDNGTKLIALKWPQSIEKNTQRRFVRVDLHERTLPRVLAWGIRFKQTPPVINIKNLGKPIFSFDPAQKNSVNVHDISEGGIRVSLVPTESEELVLYIQPQHYLLLLLSLPQKDGEKDQKLLVVARIARMQKHPRGRVSLGLEFLFVAGKNPQTGAFVWLKVEGKGIDRLKLWVAERFLEVSP